MINALAFLFCILVVNAINLPGLSPQDYRMNHRFDLMMSYIESDHLGAQVDDPWILGAMQLGMMRATTLDTVLLDDTLEVGWSIAG